MEFNSLFFLMIFLPLFTGTMFFIRKNEIRNILLLLFSLFFYASGDLKHLPVLVIMILLTWGFGKIIKGKRGLYILYLFLVLSLLSVYKYGNYLASAFSSYLKDPDLIKIVMPLGISFYTFTSISYVSDVYRGKYECEDSLFDIACFLSFFPSVISGPLLRYDSFRVYLKEKEISTDTLAEGFRRFLIGLGKKVIIANQLSLVSNTLFSDNLQADFLLAAYAVSAYALQLYYDFSGYSDMAIGIGQMIGYRMPENFYDPYLSTSIADFWQNWHATLGTWFKDYVYIPLGGSRRGKIRTCINLFLVFLFSGLWHGSTWLFLVWGIYHGGLRVAGYLFRDINKVIREKLSLADGSLLLKIFRILRTDLLVLIGWIPFRCETLRQVKILVKAFIGKGFRFNGFYVRQLDVLYLLFYFLIGFLFLFPGFRKIFTKIREKSPVIYDLLLLLVLLISIFFLISGSYSAFIYFQF